MDVWLGKDETIEIQLQQIEYWKENALGVNYSF